MSERYPSQRPPMPPVPPFPPDGGIYEGNPACGCSCGSDEHCCAPRFCRPANEGEDRLQRCCDKNGCCCWYPAKCRNDFWPEFTHPRWLCCVDLYSENAGCYDCCAEEEEKKSCGCGEK